MALSRTLMVGAIALATVACSRNSEWAGLTKVQAVDAAKKEAIRSDYDGDGVLFNRNLWSVESRNAKAGGRKVWLVKFYDAQALKASCAYVWARRGVRTRSVSCAATRLGAGKPN
jgi:hypothetical protein